MTTLLCSIFITDEYDGFAGAEHCPNIIDSRLCLGTVRQIRTIPTIEIHFLHRLIVGFGCLQPCVLHLTFAFVYDREELVRWSKFTPVFVNDGKQPWQGFSDDSEAGRLMRKFDEIVLERGDIRVC